ncbi:MAG: ExbD/TolR family protein [Myxococcales bacterium]
MALAQMNDEEGINGINVTPLVDVTLVLLIVFMVTASVIAKAAIEVDLPRAANGAEITQRTLAVVISKEGATFLDGAKTDDEHLVEAVRVAQQKGEDVQAVVAADRAATHGAVTHLLDVLKGAGVTKFAIQIEKAG